MHKLEGYTIMRFLPSHLRKAYEYDLGQCSEIEGLENPLIGVEEVLQAHYILADYFTDSSASNDAEKMLVGLRSQHLLASALSRQIVSFGGKTKYTDPIDICSTLFYGLAKDHAFHDGNKRTALLVLISQLYNYGYYPKSDFKKFEDLVLTVADGKIMTLEKKYPHIWKKFKKNDDPEIKTISYLLRRSCEKKNRAFHLDVNMRDFCYALKNIDDSISYVEDNMKIKFERQVKQFGVFPKTHKYAIKFYGWTRPISAGVLRDVLDNLCLTQEYANFDNIFNRQKPLYKMINQFEVPFRRLKDE